MLYKNKIAILLTVQVCILHAWMLHQCLIACRVLQNTAICLSVRSTNPDPHILHADAAADKAEQL